MEMATHSSILAQKIPWTEESGGLQSMKSDRTEHTRTHAHAHTWPQTTDSQGQNTAPRCLQRPTSFTAPEPPGP